MAKKKEWQTTVRTDEKLHAAMMAEAKKLGLTFTGYVLHCHNMWVRQEEGRVK